MCVRACACAQIIGCKTKRVVDSRHLYYFSVRFLFPTEQLSFALTWDRKRRKTVHIYKTVIRCSRLYLIFSSLNNVCFLFYFCQQLLLVSRLSCQSTSTLTSLSFTKKPRRETLINRCFLWLTMHPHKTLSREFLPGSLAV